MRMATRLASTQIASTAKNPDTASRVISSTYFGNSGAAKVALILPTTKPISPSASACCMIRSEEHTSELQSLMRISYAVCCLKQNTMHATSPSRNEEQPGNSPTPGDTTSSEKTQ